MNEQKYYVIGHKDGNKLNNRVDNLKWVAVPIKASDGNCYSGKRRTIDEIRKYEMEAFDKVWLTRTHPDDDHVVESARRDNVERILAEYFDIPGKGYTNWECGYWNGIMAALRWVLGEEKDFLDA